MAQASETKKLNDSKAKRPEPNIGAPRPEQLRKLLKRKSGASIAELQKKVGWRPHTARATISGLRKAGEIIERQTGPGGSIYRIVKVATT